jgi:hypothetical protein
VLSRYIYRYWKCSEDSYFISDSVIFITVKQHLIVLLSIEFFFFFFAGRRWRRTQTATEGKSDPDWNRMRQLRPLLKKSSPSSKLSQNDSISLFISIFWSVVAVSGRASQTKTLRGKRKTRQPCHTEVTRVPAGDKTAIMGEVCPTSSGRLSSGPRPRRGNSEVSRGQHTARPASATSWRALRARSQVRRQLCLSLSLATYADTARRCLKNARKIQNV